MNNLFLKFMALTTLAAPTAIVGQLSERDRLSEYRKRRYEWPLSQVLPNTTGWDELMRRRIAQVEQVDNTWDRYNGWVSVMTQALVAPNFTENGWGLTRCPQDIVALLKNNLYKGLDKATEERELEVIEGNSDDWQRPLFVKQASLNKLVLEELKPMHEEWAGISLIGEVAYGLRIYRNQSILHMHTDRMKTHIISCILHVDHDEDSDPWPIFIEDFQGNTNEIVLERGDLLFYESSKLIHGRPRPFNGSWYSSLFVHYYPAENWAPETRDLESHYAIPQHWGESAPVHPFLDQLRMIGTSFTEPGCPDKWCNSVNTVKWNGPAKEGFVMTTGYKDLEREEL